MIEYFFQTLNIDDAESRIKDLNDQLTGITNQISEQENMLTNLKNESVSYIKEIKAVLKQKH